MAERQNDKRRDGIFDRDLLPTPLSYFEDQGFRLRGQRTWHTVPCCFHGDRNPSLRLNILTGAFHCFGCGAAGSDIVDFHGLRYGLSFIETAKELGAWYEPPKRKTNRLRSYF